MTRRLVLFDVDGTLVSGGPAKEAFRVALEDVFGTTGAIDGHEFSGKTDPQIARELLMGVGVAPAEVERGFPRLWDRYLEELRERLPRRPMEVLAGVPELLDALDASGAVALGLLTGNIEPGARAKLGSASLDGRFHVGGYGSDDEDRDRLPAIAIARARERWAHPYEPEDVIIVGDTPRDVACGLSGGCRTLAVASGRFERPALVSAGAHHVVTDLGDTRSVLDILL